MPVAHTGVYGPTPILPFRNRKKDYDARAIAQVLGIPLSTLAPILGVDPSTLSRNSATPKIRKRAAELERILRMLEELYGDLDYAVAWLKTPSPRWSEEGSLSAIELMAKEPWGMKLVYQTVANLYRGEPET